MLSRHQKNKLICGELYRVENTPFAWNNFIGIYDLNKKKFKRFSLVPEGEVVLYIKTVLFKANSVEECNNDCELNYVVYKGRLGYLSTDAILVNINK